MEGCIKEHSNSYYSLSVSKHYISDTFRDLVSFAQFKKREKHPWKSITLCKVAVALKISLLHWCFSRFLNCTNGTKSCKYHYMQNH